MGDSLLAEVYIRDGYELKLNVCMVEIGINFGVFQSNYYDNLLRCCLSLSSSSRLYRSLNLLYSLFYQEQSMVVDKSFPVTPSALKLDNLFSPPPIIS